MPPRDLVSFNATGSADHSAVVTPNDTADLDFIGTAGNVRIVTKGGQTLTFPKTTGLVQARVVRVLASGTTAAGIVALW